MKNKIIYGLSSFAVISLAGVGVISCGSSQSIKIYTTSDIIKNDQKAMALKMDPNLKGFSTENLQIIGHKQEIAKQSTKVIEAFNAAYGTNITFTQVGGSTNYQQRLTTTFNNGVGNTILVAAGAPGDFKVIGDNLISSPANKILSNFKAKDKGELVVGTKHYMSQVDEGYGVIYNKDAFKKANITVHEAQKSSDAINGIKITSGQIDVYTDGLNQAGYLQLVKLIQAKKHSIGYTHLFNMTTAAGNIWPLTNHLINAADALAVKGKVDSIDWKDATTALPDAFKPIYQNAMQIYATNGTKDITQTGSVEDAMAEVSLGKSMMSQNGTWASNQIFDADKNAHVGFLPIPVFAGEDHTGQAQMMSGASQWWGITNQSIARQKTAKLFLNWLYTTQSGSDAFSKDFKLASPFTITGIINHATDPLIKSLINYIGDPNLYTNNVDSHFAAGFNNDSVELRKLVRSSVKSKTIDLTALRKEYTRLLTASK